MKIGHLIGLTLILVGLVFLVYPSSYPQHAKIYLRVDTNSLTVLGSEIETGVPLAVLDTYIHNLTAGDRSLEIIATAGNDSILDYSVSSVGIGYTLTRTGNFKRNIPSSETLTLKLILIDRGGNKIADTISEVQGSTPYSSYIFGALALIAGIFVTLRPSSLNLRTANTKPRRKKK